MGLLDFPKKVYDFITTPEVKADGIVGNVTAGVKSLVGVAMKPFEKAWSGVKAVKDSGMKGFENIKNGATLNPIELGKNLVKGAVLTVNEGANLISNGIGGTVEVLEELDKAIADTIDYTNAAVHSITGIAKAIPVVGTTVSHIGSVALSPVTLGTKVLRAPAKVSEKIRGTVSEPISKLYSDVSGKFAISASAPSSSEAPSDAEPAAA